MFKRTDILILTIAFLCLSVFVGPVCAAINHTGDVQPDDPATWDSSTYAYIGSSGAGYVSVDNQSDENDLVSYYSFIGEDAGLPQRFTQALNRLPLETR
jgi:hypothetical protein